jgi:hypothetical protein
MVSEATNVEAVEGDLSDFSHIVPHLRVRRESVEKYGLETLSLDAFVTVVAELADLVEDILRGDDKTIDSQIDAYLYWKTDNSIGYRWTERFATYTGLKLTGLDYDDSVRNNDRFTWQFYNQFRYQLTPQTVLTGDYRYAQTEGDGLAADSTSHYLLGGVEHRFSPNTILIARAGAQIRESDAVRGNDTTSPFVELALRSQINQQFSVRAFARYANEVYDTTRRIGFGIYDFDDRQTLRIGVSSEYAVSQKVTVFGGIDYIPASFDDGRLVGGFGAPSSGGIDEDLVNAYIGVSVQFAENLYGSLSYNYTDSDSDFAGYTYDRNRINLGVRAEF